MAAVRTLRKRQTRGEAIVRRRTNKINFDLPAKVFILSVALGKTVGVLGNEARMVISFSESWSTTI